MQTLLISGAAGRSVRCGAVRAPRARALLPPRPSCGDARRRRAGSTGAASFSSARPGRPPPSAEPRDAGRAGRDGEGWAGRQRAGGSAPAAQGTDGESALPALAGLSASLHTWVSPPVCVWACIPCLWGTNVFPTRVRGSASSLTHGHMSTPTRACIFTPVCTLCISLHLCENARTSPGCTSRPLRAEGMHTNTLSTTAHTHLMRWNTSRTCLHTPLHVCAPLSSTPHTCTHTPRHTVLHTHLEPPSSRTPWGTQRHTRT